MSTQNVPDRSPDFPYHVERWSDDDQRIESVVAVCSWIIAARGAFEAAVKDQPDKRWAIRIGARVIAKHPDD